MSRDKCVTQVATTWWASFHETHCNAFLSSCKFLSSNISSFLWHSSTVDGNVSQTHQVFSTSELARWWRCPNLRPQHSALSHRRPTTPVQSRLATRITFHMTSSCAPWGSSTLQQFSPTTYNGLAYLGRMVRSERLLQLCFPCNNLYTPLTVRS